MLVEASVAKKVSVGNPVSVLSPKAPPLPPSGQKHQLCTFNCKKRESSISQVLCFKKRGGGGKEEEKCFGVM